MFFFSVIGAIQMRYDDDDNFHTAADPATQPLKAKLETNSDKTQHDLFYFLADKKVASLLMRRVFCGS